MIIIFPSVVLVATVGGSLFQFAVTGGGSIWKKLIFRTYSSFEIDREKSAEAATNICAVCGQNSITEDTTIKLMAALQSSERSSVFKENILNTLIRDYARQSTRELAYVINWNHAMIGCHFHSMGKVHKFVCVYHCNVHGRTIPSLPINMILASETNLFFIS